MKPIERFLSIFSIVALLSTLVCQQAVGADDTHLAYDKAWVLFPTGHSMWMEDAIKAKSFTKLGPDQVVVLYMHGCAGIHKPDMELIAKAGFVAIGLRSNARKDWKADCDVATKQVGMNKSASSNRQQELKYAVANLPNVPGINMRKLVLMGHSEGGKAVANWPGSEFRAVIVTGWGCRTKDAYFNGSRIPASVPVFNVVTRKDDWLFLNNGGNCADVWKNHPVKEVLYPEGTEHWVNDKYWPQIEAFIRANTR
jgi:dienelactone hydrolase